MFPLKTTNKRIFYGLIILAGLAITFFIWNNYQIQISQKSRKPIELPPTLTKKCGIESCHGLKITCGPNVPEICDMSYQLGDKCRQLASCQIINGSCQLVKSAGFDECKSCVENCERQFADNPEKAFTCEAKCRPSQVEKPR